MPTAPPLDPTQMSSPATGGANPLNFLIAAADMHKNGELGQQPAGLATPQRAIPKGQSMNLPAQAKRARKNIRIIK